MSPMEPGVWVAIAALVVTCLSLIVGAVGAWWSQKEQIKQLAIRCERAELDIDDLRKSSSKIDTARDKRMDQLVQLVADLRSDIRLMAGKLSVDLPK